MLGPTGPLVHWPAHGPTTRNSDRARSRRGVDAISDAPRQRGSLCRVARGARLGAVLVACPATARNGAEVGVRLDRVEVALLGARVGSKDRRRIPTSNWRACKLKSWRVRGRLRSEEAGSRSNGGVQLVGIRRTTVGLLKRRARATVCVAGVVGAAHRRLRDVIAAVLPHEANRPPT